MAAQQFCSSVESPDSTGATSVIEIPPEVVAGLGAGKRPAVRVTLNGFTYRTTIAVYGGRSCVAVRREVRQGAGVRFGAPLDVLIELDQEPRLVDVPADLASTLDADPALRAAFDRLSYTHRKEYVEWINGAKREETRRRRLDQAAALLREHKAPNRSQENQHVKQFGAQPGGGGA